MCFAARHRQQFAGRLVGYRLGLMIAVCAGWLAVWPVAVLFPSVDRWPCRLTSEPSPKQAKSLRLMCFNHTILLI